MAAVTVKYVGQKVSKIRWSPPTQLSESNTFVSGAWDDQINKLKVWSTEAVEENQDGFLTEASQEPHLLAEIDHEGSVTDIKYIDAERLITSSSNGCVTVYRHDSYAKRLSISHHWADLHHFNDQLTCSCTCLATNPNLPDIVSVGEDGRMIVLRMDHKKPVRNLASADCTTISGATFVKSYEVATVNFIGQLKVWDLRQKEEKPVRAMLLSGDRVPLLCIDKHPTQPHLIATGGQDGVLGLWDMRQEQYPVTLLQAHKAEVWEVMFHKSNPDHLFTCSQDGEVWQWNGSSMKSTPMDISQILNPTLPHNGVDTTGTTTPGNTTTPWLAADASKHKIETFSLLPYNRLPVNSLDVSSRNLVCGTDGEAIYTVTNLDIG